MSTTTPNLGLTKPDGSATGDLINVAVLNTNSDLIDAAVLADRNRLTALEISEANSPVGLTLPLRARKPADETVTNSIIMQNDDDLVLALQANMDYEIDVMLKIRNPGGAAGGFVGQFTFPASSYAELTAESSGFGASNVLNGTPATALASGAAVLQIAAISMSVNALCIKAKIYIRLTVAGNFQLQWCQFTANASGTIVGNNSMMVARRIG
jgi:hypothetical protein